MGKIIIPGAIPKPRKSRAMYELERDAHLADLTNRIRTNVARIQSFENSLDEIEIVETEAVVDGEEMVLFSADGFEEGVAISKADIESGEMSREDGYKALAKISQEAAQ